MLVANQNLECYKWSKKRKRKANRQNRSEKDDKGQQHTGWKSRFSCSFVWAGYIPDLLGFWNDHVFFCKKVVCKRENQYRINLLVGPLVERNLVAKCFNWLEPWKQFMQWKEMGKWRKYQQEIPVVYWTINTRSGNTYWLPRDVHPLGQLQAVCTKAHAEVPYFFWKWFRAHFPFWELNTNHRAFRSSSVQINI